MRVLATCVAACVFLASGQGLFPSYPPTPDADPSIRHDVVVAVPDRLSVERTPDRISVRFDSASPESVKITLGDRMTMGVKWELRVWGEGDARPAEPNGGVSMASPITSSDLGVLKNAGGILNRAQGGIPAPGKSYIVEEDLTIFETDIPAQHMWSPTSKKYKVLWEGKLQSISAAE
jgi:hypothetical protein